MPGFYNVKGELVEAKITPEVYKHAYDAGLSVPQYINREYAKDQPNPKYGSAFEQICASEGLGLPGKNPQGLRAASVEEVLNGGAATIGANVANGKDFGSPFGTASRILFPAAIIALVEAAVVRDYATDTVVFNDLVASELSVPTENFIQPVIDYSTPNGPMQAKAQRIGQFADAPNMLRFSTSERNKSLPTYGIGMEFSAQALRATTLDLVALTLNRYLMIEKDQRVYQYLSSIFAGDSDLNTGAVAAVTTTTLDAAATGGNVTHKSWIKFLARKRKLRKITHVVGDIDSYLKVESRTGRPGSNAYDPRLAVLDPQAVTYGSQTGFGNDVKWFIVDAAIDGGPIPANTIWALDSTKGIVRVSNTAASYTAAEEFVLRRTSAMVIHWSEDVFRMFGDTDLSPFDVLTIA
jgi:hypothetical protein